MEVLYTMGVAFSYMFVAPSFTCPAALEGDYGVMGRRLRDDDAGKYFCPDFGLLLLLAVSAPPLAPLTLRLLAVGLTPSF